MSCSLLGNASASGVPTVDVAAIAQATQTLMQLKEQYDLLNNQYAQMQREYQSITGTRNLGMIFHNPAIQHLMTGEASKSLLSVFENGKRALSGEALEIYNKRGLDRECQNMSRDARLSCEVGMAATAAYQAHLQSTARVAKQRMDTVNSLMRQIDLATDQKSIQDLQARIQAEQVQLRLAEAEAYAYQTELRHLMKSEEELRVQRQMQSVYAPVSRERIRELLK